MTPHTPNSTILLPRRIQRPLRPPPTPAPPYADIPADAPGCSNPGAIACAAWATAACAADLGSPPVAAALLTASPAIRTNCLAPSNSRSSWLQASDFQAERAARGRGEAAADLRAERTADEGAESGAGQRQCLLGDAFQNAADRLSDGRTDDLADGTPGFPDQVAEKLIELLLVVDLQELGGQLQLVGLAEYAFAVAFARPFGLLEFEILHLGIELELRAIDVVHGVLRGFIGVSDQQLTTMTLRP